MTTYIVTGHPLSYGELNGVPPAEINLIRRVTTQPVGGTLTITLTATADTAARVHGILR